MLIEILNDQNETETYEVGSEATCFHKVMNNWSLRTFRIWSRDMFQQKSQAVYEREVDPVPPALVDYVTHLRKMVQNNSHFKQDMGEYAFKLALLERTSQEVKTLQDGLHLLYNESEPDIHQQREGIQCYPPPKSQKSRSPRPLDTDYQNTPKICAWSVRKIPM